MIFSLASVYWIYLIISVCCNAIFMHINYASNIDKSGLWYPIACAIFGVITSVVWGLMIREASSNEERFIVSQVWDFVPVLFFCLLPPLLYDVGMYSWKLWIGIALICIGTIMIGTPTR